MSKKSLFWLLAGALLQDTVNYDNDLLCSNANITDDLALYHLKTNPKCRRLFQEVPENVDELIEGFQLPTATPEAEPVAKTKKVKTPEAEPVATQEKAEETPAV
jgi:hypothetical protein